MTNLKTIENEKGKIKIGADWIIHFNPNDNDGEGNNCNHKL